MRLSAGALRPLSGEGLPWLHAALILVLGTTIPPRPGLPHRLQGAAPSLASTLSLLSLGKSTCMCGLGWLLQCPLLAG